MMLKLSQLVKNWLDQITAGHHYIDKAWSEDAYYVRCKCYTGWAIAINDIEATCTIPKMPVSKNWLHVIPASNPDLFKLIEDRLVSIHSTNLIDPVPTDLRLSIEHGRSS